VAFEVQNKGGNVFYFKREYKGFATLGGPAGPSAYGWYTQDNFPDVLARFREENPNLDVASIVTEKNEGEVVTGYTLVCNEHNPNLSIPV